MPADSDAVIQACSPADLEGDLPAFGALLRACVHDGASIGFILPFPEAAAIAFWRDRILPPLRDGGRILLAARAGRRLVGTVQLDLDTSPNQPHRAEVSKLMVHPGTRRQGLARALMAELERRADAAGRNLLTLDTRTGDTAEALYAALGYRTVGAIPGYCLNPFEDRLEATTIMYKSLASG